MLRISEGGFKDLIDTSHDYIRTDGDIEVGHYVNHLKYRYKQPSWNGGSNEPWFNHKWTTQNGKEFIRNAPEIDWHPKYTMKYSQRFNMEPLWIDRTSKSILYRKPVVY
jgi:hypothetical protein